MKFTEKMLNAAFMQIGIAVRACIAAKKPRNLFPSFLGMGENGFRIRFIYAKHHE